MVERTKKDREMTQMKGILLGIATIALCITALILCVVGRAGSIIGTILLIIYTHAAIPFAKHLGYQTGEDYFMDIYHVSMDRKDSAMQDVIIDVPAVVNTGNPKLSEQRIETEKAEDLTDLVSKLINNLKKAVGLEFGNVEYVYTMDNTLYHIVKYRNPISIRLTGKLDYNLNVYYDDRGTITDMVRVHSPSEVKHEFVEDIKKEPTTLPPDEESCYISDDEIIDVEGIPETDIINAKNWYMQNESMIKDSCVNAANNSSDFFDCDIEGNNINAIKQILENVEGFSFKVKKLSSDSKRVRVYFAG